MRVIFLGTPDFAVRSLEALLGSSHDVKAVLTQPDRPRGRGQRVTASPVKQRAESAGIPVLQPERLKDETLLETLAALEPDIGVVAAYGRLLPQVLLDLPRLGMVNVHASLLPKYRGAAPIERAIMDGETETGVTIMRVVKELDAGPMLAKATLPIGPDETAAELEPRLAALGARLLLETLAALERGTASETPQDDSLATYAPRITKADGLIDWGLPARAIHDQVRALVPWPHAYTFHDGMRLIVHETRPHASLDAALAAAGVSTTASSHSTRGIPHPGEICDAPRGHLLVGAGGGSVVEIRRLQEEGRKVLAARDFLAGRPLRAGERFSSSGPA